MNLRQDTKDVFSQEKNSSNSNPLLKQKQMLSSSKKTANKLYAGYNSYKIAFEPTESINAVNVLNIFCDEAKYKKTEDEILFTLQSTVTPLLGLSFVAVGFFDETKQDLNIKLLDRLNNFYYTKFSACFSMHIKNLIYAIPAESLSQCAVMQYLFSHSSVNLPSLDSKLLGDRSYV